MTNRYDLLISSMRAAANNMEIMFLAALLLLSIRWLILWLVQPETVPSYVRTAALGLYDLCLVSFVLILFWVAP